MDKQVSTFSELDKQKGFKLVHLNVRSLLKKIDQVRVMLADLKLDVVTISETWLNEAVNPISVELEGFVAYRQDRNFDKQIGLTYKRKKKKKGRRPYYLCGE